MGKLGSRIGFCTEIQVEKGRGQAWEWEGSYRFSDKQKEASGEPSD